MKSVSTLDVSCLIYSRFHNGISKQNVRSVFSRRNYSTSHSADSGACNLPLPVLTISNLNNKDCIKSYRRLLKDKGGITDYGYKLRYYSTCNKLRTTPLHNMSLSLVSPPLNNKNKSSLIKFNPNYVTGFSDAESTFGIYVIKSKNHKIGWTVTMAFSIGLHIKDLDLLTNIRDFFGVGNIVISKPGNVATYQVQSIKDMVNVIIPHFNKYPLQTKKLRDFLIFKSIVKIIVKKEHLTDKGLIKINSILVSNNKKLNEEILKIYPARPMDLQIETSFYLNLENLDPHWLAGFVEGEGCFYVGIFKSESIKTGYSLKLRFSVNQHFKDEKLISSLTRIFKCGNIVISKNNSIIEFRVSSLKDIMEKIIPFFNKYPLYGAKRLEYEDFCKVVSMMNSKTHLTESGLEQIREIKSNMNRGRK